MEEDIYKSLPLRGIRDERVPGKEQGSTFRCLSTLKPTINQNFQFLQFYNTKQDPILENYFQPKFILHRNLSFWLVASNQATILTYKKARISVLSKLRLKIFS